MKGLKKYKLVGLDSNIFIYYFEENPQFGQKSKKVFELLVSDKFKAVTSIFSLVETISKKDLPAKIAKDLEEKFFEIPNLRLLEVSREIGVEAARIRREYGYRLPDSIQLATAKLNKAKAFISNDTRLKSIKGLKVLLLNEIT